MRSIRILAIVFVSLITQAFAQTRILCVGDSITEGGSTVKVYRHVLADKLKQADIPVIFVGPKKDKAGLSHGAYGGKSIEQVAVEYGKWHAQYPADVIIIHSGHNHFVEEKPIPGILATYEAVIKQAREDNPKVIVLLAKVIPSGKLPKYEYIPELNKEIGKLGEKLKVTVVDQETGFDWKVDTIQDMVHPSPSGAEKMGERFFQALKPLLVVEETKSKTGAIAVPKEFDSLPETQQQALAKASKVITYKTVDGVDLEMYVFLPEKPADGKLRPGVLYIHGGGWVGGDPSVCAFDSLYLSRQGMVCATIRYRLLGNGKKGKYSIAKSPADCLSDAKSAMRFFRSHAAEFGMDPARIAASGGSAGGHLAAALDTIPGYDDPKDDAAIPVRADALVLLYPAFDLSGGWGGGIASCKKAGMDPLKFSPATMANKSFPKTLILVGDLDPVSPPASNTAFLARMKKVGVSVELFTYVGKAHKLFERHKTDPHFQSYLIHSSRFFQELGWIAEHPLPPLPDIQYTRARSLD